MKIPSADKRVIKFPILPLKNPPTIIPMPAAISPTATVVAITIGATISILSSHDAKPSGGYGNFPQP